MNLHLGRGEVLGLLGDNGAGKSTLLKILCGFQPPDHGRILLEGEEVTLKSVDHARSLGIDAVYQDLALVNQLSVYHNMFLNREQVALAAAEQPDDAQAGPGAPGRDGRAASRRSSAEVATLSGGQRQAIAVARSVYSDAKILLLDEPLAAMGVKEGAMILDLVRRAEGAGQRLDHHHRAQLRPGAGGLRPGEPAPARRDHLRQARRDTSVQELTDMVVAEYRKALEERHRVDREAVIDPARAGRRPPPDSQHDECHSRPYAPHTNGPAG